MMFNRKQLLVFSCLPKQCAFDQLPAKERDDVVQIVGKRAERALEEALEEREPEMRIIREWEKPKKCCDWLSKKCGKLKSSLRSGYVEEALDTKNSDWLDDCFKILNIERPNLHTKEGLRTWWQLRQYLQVDFTDESAVMDAAGQLFMGPFAG